MMGQRPRFPREGVEFLRKLKRNNRREWFQARREQYEKYVRGPMTDLVLALRRDFASLAPEMVADPAISLYRIYRDTRFSADKSPYKTWAAAVFPRRGLGKHSGAGLYFHVAHNEVLIGGGIYAPQPNELLEVRRHIADRHREFRTIIEAPRFRRKFGEIEGERLSRVPKGFPAGHSAAEYLKFKQFLAGCVYPPEFASGPRFHSTLLDCFTRMLPFVRFLNEPLVKPARRL